MQLNRIAAYQNGIPPEQPQLYTNQSYEGETIEQRVEKILNNREPITDGAPQIYTDRDQGVIPEYDIRTDKWDQAIDMTNEITNRKLQDRQKRQQEREDAKKPKPEPKTEPKPEPKPDPGPTPA